MNKIRELREEKGLSQSELAGKTGLAQTSITRWERGSNEIGENAIRTLAAFFEVTCDELLGVAEYGTFCDLSLWESELLQKFRRLSEEQKRALLCALDGMQE